MVEAKDCLFCRIVKGDIPAKKVYEDSDSFAFLDINPRNPGHTLVIPKRHAMTLMELSEEEAGNLFRSVRRVAGMVMNATKAQGLSVSSSNGAAAGQMVAHVHFHIIPRYITEGPPGLEGILQVKKMDDASLNKIAENISKASPRAKTGQARRAEKPAPAPKPAVPKRKKLLAEGDEMEEDVTFDF